MSIYKGYEVVSRVVNDQIKFVVYYDYDKKELFDSLKDAENFIDKLKPSNAAEKVQLLNKDG